MIWRFTILNNRTSVATVVDEPTGWDANTSEIKRDLDWHGIFFTNQGETFQFNGNARRLLKDEYDEYGVQADMTLIMEEDCGNGFEEFSRGAFMFKNYEYICGDECYVKCPVETSSEIKDLRNRLNQKVDLEAVKSFDETTTLPTYSKLPFELELPSKGMYLKNNSIKKEETNEKLSSGMVIDMPGSSSQSGRATIELALDDISSEIGNYGFSPTTIVTQITDIYLPGGALKPEIVLLPTADFSQQTQQLWNGSSYVTLAPTVAAGNKVFNKDLLSSIVNYQPETNNYDVDLGVVNVSFLFEAEIEPINSLKLGNLTLYFARKNSLGEIDFINVQRIFDDVYSEPIIGVGNTYKKVKINLSYSNPLFILNKKDMLYLFISAYTVADNIDITNVTDYFNINIKNTSYFKFESLSKTPATTSKVFAINETISRIAESITNNNVKAYSEYFGRTDSEPYSHSADGCGSLEVLTNGLRLRRQENKILGKTNLFTLSLQDIWEGLNPIHNIGIGLEPDTNRAGYNRLRVEPWNYFYNNTVVLSCTNINKISRKVYEKEIFSTFQFGYQKWEAEEYTGLDEFLTKRTYRTTLNQIKNDFVKLSKFVYSGYALEITRRKGDDNSKDWRYDKDVFGICLMRNRIIKEGIKDMYFEHSTSSANWCESFVGTELPVVGDTISFPNSTLNTLQYTITFIAYNGLVDFGGCFDVRLIVTPALNLGTESDIHYVITRNKLSVELGNVSSPQNIIDPATLYNYRRSPIRNAMRWMNKILASYKQFNVNSKIIFTDGDANYYAAGEMTSTRCKLENAVLDENETIDLTIYADSTKAQPFTEAERVVFDYPMTSKEYKQAEANPYGLIYFQGDCEEGYGWIDTVHYKAEQGLATFNLIPKI
jgi:hypothetical protein